jgi:prephenate dehydrogenase
MSAVAVVGVGLMGASLGLALRERAGITAVLGVDTDPGALDLAARRGAISEACSLDDALGRAECVVLAAPVTALPGLAERVLAGTSPDTLVTDLGSTKSGIMRALDAEGRRRFIGGHPVCGGESSGPGAARADLFEGATWFLTPGAEARADLYERLHRMVGAVGARATAIAPEVHDRLMALVSHLPHVLATALVNQAADSAPEGREALDSAGPSFHDLTRVAGSNPELWADILLDNRDAVMSEIAALGARLERAAAALRDGDREWLAAELARGQAARERLRAPRSDAGPGGAISVAVPDRPGALSEIATALGHAHINIADLSLRPGPPGGVGVVRLELSGGGSAERAIALLGERGFTAERDGAALH